MNSQQIIERLFSVESRSEQEEQFLRDLSHVTGKSISSVRSAVEGCRNKKFEIDFKNCVRKKLKLGRSLGI